MKFEYLSLKSFNKEDILLKLNEEDIFEYFMQEKIIIDRDYKYVAPYRNDINPGCYFEKYEDRLYFIDFGDINKTHKDFLDFTSAILGISKISSLNWLYTKFDLKNKPEIKREFNINKLDKEKNKQKTTIKIEKRNWKVIDKEFWEDIYQIPISILIRDKVIPLKSYEINTYKNQFKIICDTFISYAYTEFKSGNIKIYSPEQTKYKWFCNTNTYDIGNINNINYNKKNIIITKSYKDSKILELLNFNSLYIQNEICLPNKGELIEILNKFNNIYILFDNDNTGKIGAEKYKFILKSILKYKNINNIILNNNKDCGEYIKNKQKKELIVELNKIIENE